MGFEERNEAEKKIFVFSEAYSLGVVNTFKKKKKMGIL